VPLGVFRRPPLMIAAGVMVLGGATLASLFFFLPLYQQEVLGMDALTTGMTQIPLAVMIIVGSALAPLLAQWLGLRGALPAGLAILLAGLAWLALNSAPVFGWQHLVAFVLIGTGLGLSSVNAIAMVCATAPTRNRDCSAGSSTPPSSSAGPWAWPLWPASRSGRSERPARSASP